MSFYSRDELLKLGFKSVGHNVKVSQLSVFYHPERISLGNNVRIDDFCTISACEAGFVVIKDYVHIAAYCYVEAPAGIEFREFSGLAARCTVYGGSDDYGGEYLTNPCVPIEYRKCDARKILIGKHVVVGACSVILPGTILNDGAAVGSMSLVKGEVRANKIVIGVPARPIKNRSTALFDLELQLTQKTKAKE